MMECLRPFIEKVLSRDGKADPEERTQRKVFLSCQLIGLFFTIFQMMVLAATDLSMERIIPNVAITVIFIPCLLSVVTIMCGMKWTNTALIAAIYTFSLAFTVGDWEGRTIGVQRWPLQVMMVDLLLVLRVDDRFALMLVVFVSLWLIFMAAEDAYRFGVLDVPGLRAQEDRREYFAQWTEGCTELPCSMPVDQVMTSILISLCVFVFDFIATRGFARQVRAEKASMKHTISTVQKVAILLAGYDVDTVAELLETHKNDLPEEMLAALRTLEENLRLYKPYLPKTCLPYEEDKDPVGRESTPPLPLSKTPLLSHKSQKSSASQSAHSSSGSATPTPPASDTTTEQQTFKAFQPLGLTFAKVTLFTVNVKNTLCLLKDDNARFTQMFTKVLESTLRSVHLRRGMVDVFIGDKVVCSFNATKSCATHSSSALHTATLMVQNASPDIKTQINFGIASGKVLRGDLGCEAMRRFSVIGDLVHETTCIERAGGALCAPVLCNQLCFSNSECEHELRLVPCKLHTTVDGADNPVLVAELLVPAKAVVEAVDEWMYLVGGKKEWEDYNQAVRKYLKGVAVEEAAESAGEKAAFLLNVVRNTLPSDGVLRMYPSYLDKRHAAHDFDA